MFFAKSRTPWCCIKLTRSSFERACTALRLLPLDRWKTVYDDNLPAFASEPKKLAPVSLRRELKLQGKIHFFCVDTSLSAVRRDTSYFSKRRLYHAM